MPKSTTPLERGDFWAIPLKDGSFGAGCVVGRALAGGKVQSRIFIAGVVAWHGTSPPEAEQLFGRRVVEHAFAHIKAITESGGQILGRTHLQLREVPAEADSLSLPAWGFGLPKNMRPVTANLALKFAPFGRWDAPTARALAPRCADKE